MKLAEILAEVPASGLFGGGDWLWSPEPLQIPRALGRQLESLGHPLARFYEISDQLYAASLQGKMGSWVASTLNAGKPDFLLEEQAKARMRGKIPAIIRPDLLWTEEGLKLTELDSVPGGVGVTACLSEIYAKGNYSILGGSDGILKGVRRIFPQGAEILVSDEAADYRLEMQWLAARLGNDFSVKRAEDWREQKEVPVYRFFELFDHAQIPAFVELMKRMAEDGAAPVLPSFLQHVEEKIWLAMFWAPGLREYWKNSLRASQWQRLADLIPKSWVVDPTPLPPHAALPWMAVNSWEQVAEFSQKERRLVLKISGFHELAWGSRGVFIGHDLSGDEWKKQLREAQNAFETSPWMVQEFAESKLIEHPYFDPATGEVKQMKGRVRLCPYYFRDAAGWTELAGCLATIVPADKKKIHGMKDGILVPCQIGGGY